MLERIQPILRILCLALAGLLVYQVAFIFARKSPLETFVIPAAASSPSPEDPSSPRDEKPTNSVATPAPASIPGAFPGPRPGLPPQPKLPPEIQARVDKITQSEILAPVIRPLPMALLGIAGNDVFLRAPNGQTGMVREGGELGGVKLLQIGTNRVLVEVDGQKKELVIFSGFGSETLLPTGKDHPQ